MSATDVATLFLTAAMRINRFTPLVSQFFNVKRGDEGRPLSDFTHRLEYADLLKDAQSVLADLAPVERTIRTVDGHWLLLRVRPYRTLEDKIEGVIVTFVDITERQEAEKKWENQQRLLLQELAHRVRNSLAVVQAIVSRTLRASNAEPALHDALISRLHALAKSHAHLVNNEWKAAELKTIIHDQLEVYIAAQSPRLSLQGPAVHLPVEAAVPIGLLLHELATNALKYGSLSGLVGRVTVESQVIETDAGRRLRLVWTESGGPPVTTPVKTGFGTELMERGLPEATVQRHFRQEGFACTIELTLPETPPTLTR
jgi:two-component system, chemotaxis family, CheB/CheR fusion protein